MIKKYWEINSPSLDESIQTACKQIQKFSEKRNLKPVKLIRWKETATEIDIGIEFESGALENITAWINNNRVHA